MKRFFLYFLSLASPFLFADDRSDCCAEDLNTSFTLKYREGDGVGYRGGYGTLEFLVTPNGINSFQYFVDLRAHILQGSKGFAANAGLGLRYSSDSCSPIFGANLYYDFRDHRRSPSHQIGAGLETFFEYVDLRVNGYIPVGTTVDRETRFTHFSGNNLHFETTYVAPLPKVEAEVGGFIPGISWVDLYLGLGGYYLFQRTRDHERLGDAFGGAARLSVRPADSVTLEVDYSYDSIFKSRVQGVISFSIPMGPSTLKRNGNRFQSRYGSCECQQEMLHVAKMVTPPQRAEIIPLEKKRVHYTQNTIPSAVSGGSSLSNINVIFVSPFGGNPIMGTYGSGSGTFEDPYTSLSEALNSAHEGDIFYVYANGGTVSATSDPISLENQQRFIGSGVSFDYFGTLIPPFARDAGKLVYLSPTSEEAILTYAANNEIAGFAFVLNSSAGVSSDANGPTRTLTIRNCLFQPQNSGAQSTGASIYLSGGNTVTLENNQFMNLGWGIDYNVQDSGQLNSLTITGNRFNNVSSSTHAIITCSSNSPLIHHLFDVEQNNFGVGSFNLTRAPVSPENDVPTNGVNITFINNSTTSGYTFNNSGTHHDTGPIMITVLPGQEPDQRGVATSNGNPTVTFTAQFGAPILVVSP